MSTRERIREVIYVWYWTIRLIGHRVDPAKVIIYNTKRWRFIVEDGTYKMPRSRYNKYRLHLHTAPWGRIQKITIG